jgi:hypothetical protein
MRVQPFVPAAARGGKGGRMEFDASTSPNGPAEVMPALSHGW